MKLNKFILIIPAVCFIFFGEMILHNKVPLANDSIAHAPIKKWNESIEDSSGIFPQWFPNLFQVCHRMEHILILAETQPDYIVRNFF